MLTRIGLNHNLQIFVVTIFTNLLARYTWYALLPLHLRALGASDLEIGYTFTAMTLARNIFSFVGGTLADRYGRRILIALSTIVMGPFYALGGFGRDWFAVAAALVCAEICGAFQWPPISALITESSEKDRVARSFSFTESAMMLGLIGGPVLGAALLKFCDIQNLMLATGGTLVVTGILRGVALREAPRKKSGTGLPDLRAALDANVAWFTVANVCLIVSFAIVFGPYFAILARDAWHNTDAGINLLWAAGSIAALGGVFAGRLSDHWGGKRVLGIGALGFGIGTMVWGIAPTWEWGIAPLLVAFFFSEMAIIAQQTLQADITTPATRSSVIGAIATVTGLFGGAGPTFGAWLITVGGNPLPFLAAGALGLLILPAIAPLQKISASHSS